MDSTSTTSPPELSPARGQQLGRASDPSHAKIPISSHRQHLPCPGSCPASQHTMPTCPPGPPATRAHPRKP